MYFQNINKRIDKINDFLAKYGIKNLDEASKICEKSHINVKEIVLSIQPIAFDDAVYAYTVGCAVAVSSAAGDIQSVAKIIGEALQSFCIEGSVAEKRNVGIGHGNLAARLLDEDTKCFAFLAGHESFAAAEGAIGISNYANKVRKSPLKVILCGLGKDAARIISRVNGFTYVQTKFDFEKNKLFVTNSEIFSKKKCAIFCYGANEFLEGVEILKHEKVDISITGNSTNPVRFQHLVAGMYKKWCNQNNKKFFSVASGGGTGRTLHPDNVAAGPSSYGLTDSMGKMHSDVQFAGSSSVPAHVEMMGFIGMGNNPIVGATVTCASEVFNRVKKC